jgi:Flp pilus assembly pilin Flp
MAPARANQETAMRKLEHLLVRICKDAGGVTVIEYGFLAGLIAIAMIVGLTALGNAFINAMANTAADLAARPQNP